MNRGRFLVFEGLDGCGKTTQAVRLVDAMRAAGRDVVATREPTDGPDGRRIREMARSGREVAPEQELRWFIDDRRRHVDELIEPSLAAGRDVLSDRYFLSTVAYQGARGLDWRALLDESEATFPTPDLVLLLQLPAETGLARVRSRGGVVETVFERADYLERVDVIFRGLDRPYIARVDGGGSEDEVHAAVVQSVVERLGSL